MMKNDWYDDFIEALYKKYPKKSQLTEALIDLLEIEKESVYRRLRKSILFTVPELAKISSEWNISLDEIVGNKANEIVFKVQILNYFHPTETEQHDLQALIQRLNQVQINRDMEYMEVLNQLPRSFTVKFPYLNRFFLLKWAYYYDEEKTLPFSKAFHSKEMLEIQSSYIIGVKKIANSILIWDQLIFNHLVNDIRYFHSICLITDEEKELLKKDLFDLLDYLNEVLISGCWPETGKKVSLYISHTSIDANYSYFYSEKEKMCRVHVFTKSELYAHDPQMIENFRKWMQLKKRSSVQISVADERSRIQFLNKQQKLIESL